MDNIYLAADLRVNVDLGVFLGEVVVGDRTDVTHNEYSFQA